MGQFPGRAPRTVQAFRDGRLPPCNRMQAAGGRRCARSDRAALPSWRSTERRGMISNARRSPSACHKHGRSRIVSRASGPAKVDVHAAIRQRRISIQQHRATALPVHFLLLIPDRLISAARWRVAPTQCLEESPAAKDAIKQILVNSRMCAEGLRPICQDTGIVTVFVKVGMNVRWDGDHTGDENDQRGSATRLHESGQPAARVDRHRPAGRARTRATTRRRSFKATSCPATRGSAVAAKGGGSENKAKLATLNPTDRSWTGCWSRYQKWGPAGVRRE